MTESEVVSVGRRRSRREINRLVVEFESSGLRQSEFCHKHGLAVSTLQRGLKRRRSEVGGPSEGNPLVEVKVAGSKGGGSGPGIYCVLCGHDTEENGETLHMPPCCSAFLFPGLAHYSKKRRNCERRATHYHRACCNVLLAQQKKRFSIRLSSFG